MPNISLDLKTKIQETNNGILLEIGEYETWFSKQFITINNQTDFSPHVLVWRKQWKGYCNFKSVFTNHETVNHQDGYVSKTGVNTNQIESVWKHIRKTFKTHIKVAKHHVHLYAKEAAYKFNKIPSFETVMLCLI